MPKPASPTPDQVADRAETERRATLAESGLIKPNVSIRMPLCRNCEKPRQTAEFVYQSLCEDCWLITQGLTRTRPPKLRGAMSNDRHMNGKGY